MLCTDFNFLVFITIIFNAFNDRLHFILDLRTSSQLLAFQFHVFREKVGGVDQEQDASSNELLERYSKAREAPDHFRVICTLLCC